MTQIPWPIGKRGRHLAIILYGDLLKAVRQEANIALEHWWGVRYCTVNKWRRALGVVGQSSPGSSQLRREHFDQPWGHRARKLAWAKARDPVRLEKIADSRRGKPRPAHVMAALRKANLGRPLSDEHRRKKSETAKRRGIRPPKAERLWWHKRMSCAGDFDRQKSSGAQGGRWPQWRTVAACWACRMAGREPRGRCLEISPD